MRRRRKFDFNDTIEGPRRRLNENTLRRVVFYNKSWRLRGAANAARTRTRMASEQDEEEEQVSGEWRRTSY